jgi:hypothetical protein
MVTLILTLVIVVVILLALPEKTVVAIHSKVRTTVRGWFDNIKD